MLFIAFAVGALYSLQQMYLIPFLLCIVGVAFSASKVEQRVRELTQYEEYRCDDEFNLN